VAGPASSCNAFVISTVSSVFCVDVIALTHVRAKCPIIYIEEFTQVACYDEILEDKYDIPLLRDSRCIPSKSGRW